ncbi:hypothetical protein HYW43_02430 [Candidatus Daviesbacteria bacterium]|nr:hypothetical protein [Candidatus Daviesbacteria bacterium]
MLNNFCEREHTAEEIERIRWLKCIAVPKDYDITVNERRSIGLHGTSIETIIFLIEKGVLPGSPLPSYKDKRRVQNGDIFFAEFPEELPEKYQNSEYTRSDELPAYRAFFYAEETARQHYLLTTLGLPFSDQSIYNASMALSFSGEVEDKIELAQEKFAQPLERNANVPRRTLLDVLARCDSRKGVVLGIHESVRKHYIVDLSTDGDFRFNCSQGLDIKYLTLLLPFGRVEQGFLKKLFSRY